jgi:hypothetical protein
VAGRVRAGDNMVAEPPFVAKTEVVPGLKIRR